MNASLTPAEQRVYGRIREDLITHGRAPSYAELAEVGVSKGNAHRVVTQLVRKGLLRRAPGRGRGLRLVPGADSYTIHLKTEAGAQLQALAAARGEVPEVIITRALADYLGRAA